MQWYTSTAAGLRKGQSYSHRTLIDSLRKTRPNLSSGTYHWAISELVRERTLIHKGYDEYILDDEMERKEYTPGYSEMAEELMKEVSTKFPYVPFTIFEMTLLNEFLNHLIASNTIYIQAEKEVSVFIFRYLQEKGYENLTYKPTKKEYDLYWTPECVVVTDLISEAPLSDEKPHRITIEKMLVDICADKLIAASYGQSEYPEIVKQVREKYRLDQARMMRYARRRNRAEFIKRAMEEG